MKTDNVIRFDWAAKYMLRDKSSFVILEGFLSALLNEEVKIMELLESESNRKNRDAKSNRVDIKATDSKGEKKAKMEMAKRMLEKGMSKDDILGLTGLSLEELDKNKLI